MRCCSVFLVSSTPWKGTEVPRLCELSVRHPLLSQRAPHQLLVPQSWCLFCLLCLWSPASLCIKEYWALHLFYLVTFLYGPVETAALYHPLSVFSCKWQRSFCLALVIFRPLGWKQLVRFIWKGLVKWKALPLEEEGEWITASCTGILTWIQEAKGRATFVLRLVGERNVFSR